MTYAPKSAGHDDAPLEQAVMLKDNPIIAKTRDVLREYLAATQTQRLYTVNESRMHALNTFYDEGRFKIPGLDMVHLDIAFTKTVLNELQDTLLPKSLSQLDESQIGRLYTAFITESCGPLITYARHDPICHVLAYQKMRDAVIVLDQPPGEYFGDEMVGGVVINRTTLDLGVDCLWGVKKVVVVNHGTLHIDDFWDVKLDHNPRYRTYIINAGELVLSPEALSSQMCGHFELMNIPPKSKIAQAVRMCGDDPQMLFHIYGTTPSTSMRDWLRRRQQ